MQIKSQSPGKRSWFSFVKRPFYQNHLSADNAADNTKKEKQNEQNIDDETKTKTVSEERNIISNGVGPSEADTGGVNEQNEVDDGKFIYTIYYVLNSNYFNS